MQRDELNSRRTGSESRVIYYTISSPRANSHDGTTARITLTLRRLSIRYLHQSLRRKPQLVGDPACACTGSEGRALPAAG
jgi:hypothetical protein